MFDTAIISKKIQENYSHLTNNTSVVKIWPPVFNATLLNSLFTYPGGTNKEYFYCEPEEAKLNDLILKRRLLMHATRNSYLMLCGFTPQPIELALNYKKLTRTPSSQPLRLKTPSRFFRAEPIDKETTLQTAHQTPAPTANDLIFSPSPSLTIANHFNSSDLASLSPGNTETSEVKSDTRGLTKILREKSDADIETKTPSP